MSVRIFFFITFLSFSSSQIQDFQTICQAGIRQDNTNYIHCGRKQLQTIPTFARIINTFYDELVLNDNQITEISSNAFQGLRVKRLNLSGNKIRWISSDAFIELSNYLDELIIEFDSNFITEIPEAIQRNLINLRSLKLINLNLRTIFNRTFVKFRKLESLTILKSNIQSIEFDAFHSLKHLRSLNLDQNFLNDSSWNSLIQHLFHLESLSLSQNYFQTLRSTKSKSLKSLDLSSNGLQNIDNRFDSSLEKLDLQNNELNSLQLIFLFSLKHLKELNLDFNRLTFLPENIFQSNSQLNYLSLQGNDLNFLTNFSFFGLNNLIHLNLARNRLQFSWHCRPFQDLKSLKILNLDRNLQMNLTEQILKDLAETLVELSLQNCNLTEWNYTFEFFRNLQRVKLSSNVLKTLPRNFLSSSVISLDLQRNLFDSIPNLNENRSSQLTDLDLSSNQISTLNSKDLSNYPNLKTIGLTGNPLNCNCHLKWIKQWLNDNYDHDLIRFLQWTCLKPQHLFGKQLTAIQTNDMICDDETTTIPSTTTDKLIIHDIQYNSEGILIISWEDFLVNQSSSYYVQIYDEKQENLLFERLVNHKNKSIEINMKTYPTTIVVCLSISQRKFCRKFLLPSNMIKSASLIFSSNKQYISEQLIYLLLGLLLGAIFICCLLIMFCYYHLQSYRKTNEKRHISTKTCLYHSLNHPTYQHPSQHESNRTSECSLHSSVDITDPYHFYQQIPSVQNCQIYSTRTHAFI